MPMKLKTLKVFEPFVLGFCKCGCNTKIPVKRRHVYLQKFVKGHHRRNIPSGHYKGGRYLGKKGWFVFKPGYFSSYKKGHVLEHQYVYQEHYKCCMLPWGVVYHINGDRLDNRIENLQGMTNSQFMCFLWSKRLEEKKKLL